jgi:hypothetical protein
MLQMTMRKMRMLKWKTLMLMTMTTKRPLTSM